MNCLKQLAVLVLAMLSISMTGCYAPFPVMQDPLASANLRRSTENPALSQFQRAKVALIVSDNSKSIIAWQTETRKQHNESVGAALFVTDENRKATDSNLDSNNLVLRAAAVLKRQFSDIVVAPDVRAAQKLGDIAVLLDIQIKHDLDSGLVQHTFTETWTIGLYFIKGGGTPNVIREISAKKSGKVTGGGNELVRLTNELEARLREEVFDELDRKLAAAM